MASALHADLMKEPIIDSVSLIQMHFTFLIFFMSASWKVLIKDNLEGYCFNVKEIEAVTYL